MEQGSHYKMIIENGCDSRLNESSLSCSFLLAIVFFKQGVGPQVQGQDAAEHALVVL